MGLPELADPPRLVWAAATVRDAFLAGECADCLARAEAPDWLAAAGKDFDAFVAGARGVQTRWRVPSSLSWYVSGEH